MDRRKMLLQVSTDVDELVAIVSLSTWLIYTMKMANFNWLPAYCAHSLVTICQLFKSFTQLLGRGIAFIKQMTFSLALANWGPPTSAFLLNPMSEFILI